MSARALDVWDCLVYGSGPLENSQRLFGNRNIGNLSLTNLMVAGMLSYNGPAFVTNWYARTNIPDGPTLAALGEMAMCTLVVGHSPARQEPLSALLRRRDGDIGTPPDVADRERADFLHAIADYMPFGTSTIRRLAAERVVDIVKPRLVVTVFDRQNVSVQVDIFGDNTFRFNRYLAELDGLPQARRDELPPGHPADHPGIWIHLEGWTVERDR